MSLFDDGFDTEDATIIAGIMGFAEESIKEENTLLEDLKEDQDIEDVISNHGVLQRLHNENPGLVEYLLKIVVRQREELLELKRQRNDFMEVEHELRAMGKIGE